METTQPSPQAGQPGGTTPTEMPMRFDLGFGIAGPPEIAQPLYVAQSVANGLVAKINAHITNEVATAAATTDNLLNKIHQEIQGVLGQAGQTLLQLHRPILTDIAGSIGAVMEGASKLGVVPPQPDLPGLMPAFVQVRSAALQGDLGPALEQYRLTALPFKEFQTLPYAQAVQAIESALPDNPQIRDTFAKAVANISTEPQPLPPPTGDPIGPPVDCAAAARNDLIRALADARQQFLHDPTGLAKAEADAQARYALEMSVCNPGGGSGSNASTGGTGGVPLPPPPPPPPPFNPPLSDDPCIQAAQLSYARAVQAAHQAYQQSARDALANQNLNLALMEAAQAEQQQINACNIAKQPPPPPPPPPPLQPCQPPFFSPTQNKSYSGGDVAGISAAEVERQISLGHSDSALNDATTALTAFFGWPVTINPGMNACSGKQYNAGTFTREDVAFTVCVSCPPSCCKNPQIKIVCDGDVQATTEAPPQPPPPPPPPPPPLNVVVNEIPGCKEFGKAPGLQLPDGVGDISIALGLKNLDGTLNVPVANPGLADLPNLLINTFIGFVVTNIDQYSKLIKQFLQQTGCVDGQQIALLMSSFVADFVSAYTGWDLSVFSVPNKQQRNYLCPTGLPSTAEAATAWLANTISVETLECWVRAAGMRFPEFKKYVDANRQKFPIFQIGSLYLRGKLTDTELVERIRQTGMTLDSDVTDLKELLKIIPPPTDLVRFMVRDTDDINLVNKFGMDSDFQLKYGQKIKDWAKASGVSDEYMQYVWRAHWSIPSPGQLYELLHRSAALPPGHPAAVTVADVKAALEQQDILPFWIEPLLNASYRPLTRIDAKRAFQIGTLNEDGLKKSYTDQGYDDTNANTLVEYNKKQVRLTILRSSVVNQFSNGWVSDQEFTDALTEQGASQDDIDAARQRGMTLLRQKQRKGCADAYRKRVLLGDLSLDDARASLVYWGIPADVIDLTLTGWQCELSARGKAIPASELSALYADGTIDAPDLVRRLQRLGYGYEDAVLLARRVATVTNQRLTKQNEADLKKQAAENAKQQRDADRQANREAAAAAKDAKRILSMQRVNTLREKRLMEFGRNFSTHSGFALSDAVGFVKSVYRGLLSTANWLPDEIIAAIATVSGDKAITDTATFAVSVNTILQN